MRAVLRAARGGRTSARPTRNTLGDVISCPGAESCRLAVTQSRGLGRVADRAPQRASGPRRHGAVGRTSRSAAARTAAASITSRSIGFQGSVRKVGGAAVPQYFVLVGGGCADDGTAHFGKVVSKVPVHRLTDAVERLLSSIDEQHQPDEELGAFFRRVPPATATEALKDLAQLLPNEVTDAGLHRPRRDAGVQPRGDGRGVLSVVKFELRTSPASAFPGQRHQADVHASALRLDLHRLDRPRLSRWPRPAPTSASISCCSAASSLLRRASALLARAMSCVSFIDRLTPRAAVVARPSVDMVTVLRPMQGAEDRRADGDRRLQVCCVPAAARGRRPPRDCRVPCRLHARSSGRSSRAASRPPHRAPRARHCCSADAEVAFGLAGRSTSASARWREKSRSGRAR